MKMPVHLNPLTLIGLLSALPASLRADLVVDWNQEILNVIRTTSAAPPLASRAMAILHTSIYDAVNGAVRENVAYHVGGSAPSASSPEAAAIGAAYTVMTNLYPSQTAHFTAVRDAQIAALPPTSLTTNGEAWGASVATQILAWRATDGAAGSNNPALYTPTGLPGHWAPTPAAYAPPLFPGFGSVTPWTMSSGYQFRPPGPPALGSLTYADDYNMVKDLGSISSATRTADQTQIAKFWADGGGTYTPPGHWNAIAQSFAAGLTIHESAKLFAALNVATADAAVAAWDAKYVYDFWRPVTAIRAGDTDGNASTTVDLNWAPLIGTPAFPEYVSGHSTFSGAAAAVLNGLIGGDLAFSTQGDTNFDGIYDTTRSFANFDAAASEAGSSRIYGGIHFNSANLDGLATGHEIGNQVLAGFFAAVPEASTWVLALAGGLIGCCRRRR
ncbi:MAG: phosphatase PAP2 family protein [Verrucomicrobia bacterium]|nr:phosphatase PAP2 family protein [Verrucomicrobiota bacterium]